MTISPRAAAAVALLAARALPLAAVAHPAVICPLRRLTGVPCPACGLTRSWQAAANLELRESVAQHPFGLASMAVALWIAISGDDAIRRIDRSPRAVALVSGVWLAAWLLRLRREEA